MNCDKEINLGSFAEPARCVLSSGHIGHCSMYRAALAPPKVITPPAPNVCTCKASPSQLPHQRDENCCIFEGAHQAGCRDGEPKCLPCALRRIAEHANSRRTLSFHLDPYRLGHSSLTDAGLIEAAKAQNAKIQDLQKLVRDVDEECFGGKILKSFPEGTVIDVDELTNRLVARIKAFIP